MSIFKKLGSFLATDNKEEARSSVEEEKLAAAALMVEVAVQDGEFSSDEKQTILSLLVDRLGLSASEADELLGHAVNVQDNSNQILSFTRKIKDHFDEAGRLRIMEMLWRVVYADGVEDDYESNLMRRIAGLLYVTDKANGEIRRKIREEAAEG